MTASLPPVARVGGVTHLYGKTRALDNVTVDIPAGCMAGIIGPDGVGKSTLLGLIAGARMMQTGSIETLGGDMASARHREAVCPRIAYMPQGLGRNLYADLSVAENLDFFGRLFSQPAAERRARAKTLLKATGLDPFVARPAGKLSGGMKQKLGLCCALIHDPDLLILDEPTTGVDPLSRRHFWNLIQTIRETRPGMSVLISTAYMEEAERFQWLMAMDAGKLLATGSPAELLAQTAAATLEEAFVALVPEEKRGHHRRLSIPPLPADDEPPVIVAKNLTRHFGDFTAVNDVSFAIQRGEIFGFLGSNGCGKTTTMKMLTGLLPASAGEATLFGKKVDAADIETRRRVGYMSQSFSLYGELTVAQNLILHARLFALPAEQRAARVEELTARFGLAPYRHELAERLPLGVRQRLSLAVALIHRPEMLILDEPTSGVDPMARDAFWESLITLSREEKVTIFIATHFMNEAMRCDRISLMHAGWVLACDAPEKLIADRGAATLDEAFIACMEEAEPAQGAVTSLAATAPRRAERKTVFPFSLGRLLAFCYRESLEIMRDPVRLVFAFVGSALLMVIFGFGITTDVNEIRYAALDLDQTPASRAYLRSLAGSGYFAEQPPILDAAALQERLKTHNISLAIEIPPGFGKESERGTPTEISAWIDGTHPMRGETIGGYVQGVHGTYMQERARQQSGHPAGLRVADRAALPLQPDLREHLRHGARRSGDPAHPHPGHPHGGECGARKRTRLHHQLLRHAQQAAGIHPRQTSALCGDRHAELLPAHRRRGLGLPSPAQRQRLDPHVCRLALRHGDHGHRLPHLHVYLQPDGRCVWHGHLHDDAHDSVLRHVAACLHARRRRAHHGQPLADHLLHAHQRRSLHQGAPGP